MLLNTLHGILPEIANRDQITMSRLLHRQAEGVDKQNSSDVLK